jgi:hypothetical protein
VSNSADGYLEAMNRISLVVGVVLALGGAVWLLQGLDVGFAPQSPMTGETTWVVLGAAAVVAGLFLVWRSVRRPR